MRVIYWAKLALAKPQLIAALNAVPGTELVVCDTLDAALAALPGATGFITYDAPAAEARRFVEVLDAPDGTVRWMHILSAGREGWESAGLPRKVQISWAAGGVSPTVAEHAIGLLLAVGRRVHEAVVQTREGRWDRGLAARAVSLEGANLLIVGLGHIGRELARRARGFGPRIVAVTRTVRADPLVDEVLPMSEFHAQLAKADAIVVTAALTPETRHLLNAEAFALCKPRAIVVNIARGGLIDQVALREALVSGKIAGAGIDVTDPEPLPAGDPLWSAPNLIISPHYAGGGSPASLGRLASGAADNLRRLAAGEPLQNLVE